MLEELKEQMAKDLNIYRYENELSNEYNQRLIYSGLASWVRSLICGNSISDNENNIKNKFPDIMYIQSNLTKIAEAFLKTFEIDESWIEVEDNQSKSSKFASEIINRMIYLNEVAEVNSRQLAPVPKKIYENNGWTHVYGNDTFDRNLMILGLSQWSDKRIEGSEQKERIIYIKGKDYIEHICNNFEWKDEKLRGKYELFKVGSERGYAKSWILFDEQNISNGLYLLREADNYQPGYILLKKDSNSMKVSFLDPWYRECSEIYRIMYALNFENGTPAKFRIKDMGEYFVLFYPSRLPNEENKILLSLSWPYRNYKDEGSRIFTRKSMKIVFEEIENLGAYIAK